MAKWLTPDFARIPILSSEEQLTGDVSLNTPVLAFIFSWIAKFSLGAAILLSPFRLRFTIFEKSFTGVYEDYTNGLVFIADIFLILLLVEWLLDRLVHPRKFTFGPLVITIPLTGLVFISLMSVVFSSVPLISAYFFIRMLILFVFYFYLVNEIRDIKVIILPLTISIGIQAFVAILQVLEQKSIGLQVLGEYLLDPAWRGISIVYAQGIRSLRAYGLTDHPNILGGFLAFSLILVITWQAMKKNGLEAARMAIIMIGLVSLLLTFSRSAWLGFLIGMGLVVLVLALKRLHFETRKLINLTLAGLIILMPFFFFYAPYLGVRLNRDRAFQEVENEVQALQERAALNSAGNEIFVSNALTGVGLGVSPIELMWHKPVFPYYYQPPHNTFLDAAVETGLFGATFYGILMIAPWLLILFRWRRISFTPGLIAASGALLALTVIGLFDYYTWMLAPGRFWQYLLWGLWGSFYQLSIQTEKND